MRAVSGAEDQLSTSFTNSQELLDVVKESMKTSAPKMKLIREITHAWMACKVDDGFPPLTPHHTQVHAQIVQQEWYDQRVNE